MPTVPDIHRRGTRAAQGTLAAPPLTVGTLYFVTDEGVTERWNGTAWESYSGAGGSGSGGPPAAHHTTHETGGSDAVVALAGSVITSGTLPDARLSANVQMKPVAESDVTNLVSDLALKAPLASPALTGVPVAPTATAGTSTTQLATTAFVTAGLAGKPTLPISLTTDVTGTLQAAQEPAHTGDVTNAAGALALAIGAGKVTNAMIAGPIPASKLVGTDLVVTESQVTNLVSDLALKAPLASPALTGTPTAPTATAGTSTTQLATTAFVAGAVTSGGAPAAHHATHETGGTDALTALSAAILTSGTLPDARLSTNVPLKNAANAFTAAQTMTPPLGVPSGGTGAATLAAHGVLVGEGTSAVGVTGAGTAGQVLTSNGAAADPTFQAPAPTYDSGTWTPTITGDGGGSGQTYASQQGAYIKIGKCVTVSFYLQLSAKGTITGNVVIGGLPFPPATNNFLGSLAWVSLATTWVTIFLQALFGTTTLRPLGTTVAAAQSSTTLTAADLTAATLFIGTVTYFTP